MDVHRCCAQDIDAKAEWEDELERQLRVIPVDSSLTKIYETLYALTHPIRLKIALLLLQRDHCVCELVQLTGKAPNLISHHLMVMRKGRIVTSYMKSRDKYYKIKKELVPLLQTLQKLNLEF